MGLLISDDKKLTVGLSENFSTTYEGALFYIRYFLYFGAGFNFPSSHILS